MEKCKHCIEKDNDGQYLKGKCICSQLPTTTICIRNNGEDCPFYEKEQNLDKGNKRKNIFNKRMHTKMKRSWNDIKYQLIEAKEKNFKESTVEDICKEVLIDILGYEKSNIENQDSVLFKDSADFIIKDPKTKKIMWIVECKRVSEDINKRKWIEQIEKYHLEFHANWAILTNGLKWAIYYLDNKKDKVITYKVYEINDFSELANCKNDREKFYPLTNIAIRKGIREKLLAKTIALSDENIYKALISKNILQNIARILHTKLDVKVDLEAIKGKLKQICPNLPNDIQGFRK